MNPNAIVITPVENGFIVSLPTKARNMHRTIITADNAAYENLMQDDELARLQQQGKEETEETTLAKLPGVHIFKTWQEVSAFLAYKLNG